MWKKLLVIGIIIIIVVGISLGAYFIFRPSNNAPINAAPIEIGKPYYIQELRKSMYRFPNNPDEVIKLQPQDRSFAMFGANWRTFHIHFVGPTSVTFDFIVTNIRRDRGSLTATVRHIYGGEIRVYRVTTTQDRITLTATVTYRVTVASQEYTRAQIEPITRANMTVISFARTTPRYINEVTG